MELAWAKIASHQKAAAAAAAAVAAVAVAVAAGCRWYGKNNFRKIQRTLAVDSRRWLAAPDLLSFWHFRAWSFSLSLARSRSGPVRARSCFFPRHRNLAR